MVNRVYSEKRKEFSSAAASLKEDIRSFLGIEGLTNLRIINRYDVELIDRELFLSCIPNVFSEPQVDNVYFELPSDGAAVFASEYLPGQFDQRADSAAQCISLIAACSRPIVKSAVIYMLYGELTEENIEAIKHYIINPVDSREAELGLPETLILPSEEVKDVETVNISGRSSG